MQNSPYFDNSQFVNFFRNTLKNNINVIDKNSLLNVNNINYTKTKYTIIK